MTLRLLALISALLLALGAAACGDSDDDAGASKETSPSSGAEERRARAAVEALYAGMREMDANGVCGQLNPAAQKQIAQGGLGVEGGSNCVEGFEKFFAEARKAGGLNLTLKARVTKVDVDGDSAVATVRFSKAQEGEVPLTKQDGEWKLAAVGTSPN